VKTSTCSSGSVVSSYWLIVNPFQRAGSSASMIPSTKGWRLAALGLASVWLVVVCARDSSRLVPSPPFSLLRDSSLWGDSAQFALASASSPLLGRSILPRSCALILPTGSSSLLASLLLLNFDWLLLLSTPSCLRIVWPHGGRQLYLIGTILVRNQTISRTLCVEPPLVPPWTPPRSPYRLYSGGGGTCRHSDAQVREWLICGVIG